MRIKQSCCALWAAAAVLQMLAAARQAEFEKWKGHLVGLESALQAAQREATNHRCASTDRPVAAVPWAICSQQATVVQTALHPCNSCCCLMGCLGAPHNVPLVAFTLCNVETVTKCRVAGGTTLYPHVRLCCWCCSQRRVSVSGAAACSTARPLQQPANRAAQQPGNRLAPAAPAPGAAAPAAAQPAGGMPVTSAGN